MESITGKTALVIGGSGGIGAEICRQLAACGTNLIIHGGSHSSRFDDLTENLSRQVAVQKIVQRFESGFHSDFTSLPVCGALQKADIICIGFGPFIQKKLEHTSGADWETAAVLNYMLPGLIISSALPAMTARKWGRFLLIGGTRTDKINAFRTNAAYAGAKTALSSLVRSTAVSYAGNGITCNAVLPGFTRTEYVPAAAQKKEAAKMPQKRLVEAAEIAETAVFLLRQPMINGALVNIDGGWEPFLSKTL